MPRTICQHTHNTQPSSNTFIYITSYHIYTNTWRITLHNNGGCVQYSLYKHQLLTHWLTFTHHFRCQWVWQQLFNQFVYTTTAYVLTKTGIVSTDSSQTTSVYTFWNSTGFDEQVHKHRRLISPFTCLYRHNTVAQHSQRQGLCQFTAETLSTENVHMSSTETVLRLSQWTPDRPASVTTRLSSLSKLQQSQLTCGLQYTASMQLSNMRNKTEKHCEAPAVD